MHVMATDALVDESITIVEPLLQQAREYKELIVKASTGKKSQVPSHWLGGHLT